MDYKIETFIEFGGFCGWIRRRSQRSLHRDPRKISRKKVEDMFGAYQYDAFRFYDVLVATVKHGGKAITLRSKRFNISKIYSI